MKTVEFRGGLGDVFWGAFWTDQYAVLDRLAPDEAAVVILIVHNPAAVELFSFHRNAARFRIITPEWGPDWKWPDLQRTYGLTQEPRCPLLRGDLPVNFYPAPQDAEALRTAAEPGPYVVFSLSAGELSRNLPPPIAEDAASLLIADGYRVVTVGRTNYDGKKGPRREERLAGRAGVVDLIDRLTAPGLAELVRGAAGVVCCHSAACMLSWFLRKPTCVLYPPHVRPIDFASPSPFGFGKNYPECVHGEFGAYSREMLGRFLSIMREHRALDDWSRGALSTREAAARLGMTYRDFTEFASRRGYSLVPAEGAAGTQAV